MTKQYFDKFIFLLVALLIGFALFLQFATLESTEKLKSEEIKKAEQYASKISELITEMTHGEIETTLNAHPYIRDSLNKVLQAFLTLEYQYIFILKKDEKGNYRFLLDGSKEEAEEYNALFFPKSKRFNHVYEKRKMQIIKQQEGVEQIWLSLLYPILDKNRTKTEAILVMDLSKVYGEHLENFHTPLMRLLWMMQSFLLVSMVLLIFLLQRYYKLRKTILVDSLTQTQTKLFLSEFFDRNEVSDFNAILIDMDNFGEVNKKYGYKAGDRVIQKFAQRLLLLLSSKIKVIRTGGTEFLIIVPKKESAFNDLVKNIFEKLKKTNYDIDNAFEQTISMSAMLIPEGTTSIHRIQRFLDEKLLEIKSKGKNNLIILGETDHNDVRYSDMNYIKEALEEERLQCFYQPIYETQTKKIVKYEALVRLIDKEEPHKYISPFYFMERIKGTSQYIKMSKLVLREVFETLNRYPDVKLSMNFDLDDLYNEDMMRLIAENLYANQTVANRLTFEILETNEIKEYERVKEIFHQLKAYGSKIALDDFGSGYANYIYMIQLNIDILKIDGSLIRELENTPQKAKSVLRSIQGLAKELNYELVAEFVSNEKIYEMVKALEIHYSQGYYLGEPKPIAFYLD